MSRYDNSDYDDMSYELDKINHICPVDTEYDCILLDKVDVRYVLLNMPSAQPEIIKCEDCRYANECHKNVQYTRNESNMMTIGYSPIEWCSKGERREE